MTLFKGSEELIDVGSESQQWLHTILISGDLIGYLELQVPLHKDVCVKLFNECELAFVLVIQLGNFLP